ncbi:unnamed protein product [Lactuca virosa]|uniref:Uncharacterized protein n=1 Tax=Lactuca virosa TaxID=75947 RepID=A0AAU9MXC2_9ASTR|nr:unnamed protein product [Lactuca virosa]
MYRFEYILKDGSAFYITNPSFASQKLDHPSVHTYFTSSKLFINSDINDITIFKKSLEGDDRPDSSSNMISAIESKKLSELDECIVKTKLKTIAEIFEPLESNFIDAGVNEQL